MKKILFGIAASIISFQSFAADVVVRIQTPYEGYVYQTFSSTPRGIVNRVNRKGYGPGSIWIMKDDVKPFGVQLRPVGSRGQNANSPYPNTCEYFFSAADALPNCRITMIEIFRKRDINSCTRRAAVCQTP